MNKLVVAGMLAGTLAVGLAMGAVLARPATAQSGPSIASSGWIGAPTAYVHNTVVVRSILVNTQTGKVVMCQANDTKVECSPAVTLP